MTSASPTPYPAAAIKAANEIGQRLQQVLNARRAYADGHSTTKGFQDQLYQSFRAYLDASGDLVLAVRSTSLNLGEHAILSQEDARSSCTRPLALIGVQELRFSSLLSSSELERLMGLWHDALSGRLPPEHDFCTLSWEQQLSGIEIVAAEAFTEGQDSEGMALREERLVRELSSPGAQVSPAPAGSARLARLGEVEAAMLRRYSAAELATLDASATEATQASEGDLAGLKKGLEARADDPSGPLLLVWHLLGSADESERALLLPRLEGLVGQLLEAKQLAPLAKAFAFFSTTTRHAAARARDLEAAAAVLGTQPPESLAAILSLEANAASSLALLSALTRGQLSFTYALLPHLAAALQGRVAELLVQRRVPLDRLLADFATRTEADLPWLQALRGRLAGAEGAALALALLTHPLPSFRSAALGKLGPKELETHREQVLAALSDPDAKLRQQALALVVRHRFLPAVRPLGRQIELSREPGERRALLRALGAIGGHAAGATVRALFEREEEVAFKALCAQSLGQLRDTASRPLLEATAKKLLAPRPLREACEEALRQLAEPKGS